MKVYRYEKGPQDNLDLVIRDYNESNQKVDALNLKNTGNLRFRNKITLSKIRVLQMKNRLKEIKDELTEMNIIECSKIQDALQQDIDLFEKIQFNETEDIREKKHVIHISQERKLEIIDLRITGHDTEEIKKRLNIKMNTKELDLQISEWMVESNF